MLSALPPSGAIMLYWEVTQALLTAMLRVLGEVLGEGAFGGDFGTVCVHNAHGLRADGTPWQNIAVVGGEHGPWGGDQHHDGESYTVPYMVNGLDPSTEAMEQDAPVLLMRKEYVIDTAGPGFNRGGAAVLKDAFWETSGEHYSIPIRLKKGTGNGVQRGGTGRAGACWFFDPDDAAVASPGRLIPVNDTVYANTTPIAGVLNPSTKAIDPNGTYFYFAREPVWHTRAGAVSRYITNGGGGWGDPKTRDPQRVLHDVRDSYVSIAGAREMYGVVVCGDPEFDPEGLTIDHAATLALRSPSIAKTVR